MPVGVGARPPVADVLEIPHRPGLPGHEGDDLADVERGAAAESDDAVVAAGAIGGHAGVDIALDGLACTSRTPPPGGRLRSRSSSTRRQHRQLPRRRDR